jgi:euchromatic histone-lysine N-methyltransferase
VVAESSAQVLSSKEGHRSESVSECSDDFADAVSGERAVMTKKVMHTPRKSVRPPRLIQKTLHDMEFVVRPGSHLSSSVTLPEATACGHGASVAAISPVEVNASHSSSGERIGNKWHCEEMSSSAVPAIDANANVTNQPSESSCNLVAESLAQGLSKECHKTESVSECAAFDTTSSDFAAGEGAVVRNEVMHTPRKSVRPPRLIQKSLLDTQCSGQSVSMNDVEDTGVFTKDRAIQDPMSANKSTWTNGKEAAFFGPKKRVKKKKLNKRRFTVKGPAHPPINVASRSALGSIEKLEDDEVFKALAAHETKFEYVPQNAGARSKVKLICTRFESICRAIVQAAGHRSVKVRRIDLAADKLMRKLPGGFFFLFLTLFKNYF